MNASLLLADPLADQVDALTSLVRELRAEVAQLRAENARLRQQAPVRGWLLEGHARAVGRENKKEKDLDVAQAEVRQLKDARFGKRTEKQPPTDRSHDLIDPNKPTQPKSPIKTRFLV